MLVDLVRRHLARPLLHHLRRPVLMRRMARASKVALMGSELWTDPNVFHPIYFSSSRLLAEHLVGLRLRGRTVLDMGTGSGVIAVAAARAGAVVTACDVNPHAVALARDNALRNEVSVEVVESDLFAALPQRRFDIVAFNIPFYPSTPGTPYEAAFGAGPRLDTVRRFGSELPRHLAEGGRAVIVYSEDCDGTAVARAFADAGLELESRETAMRSLERFHLATFRLRGNPLHASSVRGNVGLPECANR
jgi:release factor glutamine methyltransferase